MTTRTRTFRQTLSHSFWHLSLWFGLVALYVTAQAVGILLSNTTWRVLP